MAWGAAKASATFLAEFYSNANRWRRNSDSLRKMYGLDSLSEQALPQTLAEQIMVDLQKQLENNPLPESSRLCPECSRKMSQLHIGDIEIDYCVHCQGIWFDPGELKSITGTDKDVPSEHLRGRRSRYCCPVCHAGMKELVFQNPHNLLVDCCPFGHGVYLEKDELERALDVSYPVK